MHQSWHNYLSVRTKYQVGYSEHELPIPGGNASSTMNFVGLSNNDNVAGCGNGSSCASGGPVITCINADQSHIISFSCN